MVRTIIKRDGRVEDFDVNKIAAAIYKAAIAAGGDDKGRAFELAEMVAKGLMRDIRRDFAQHRGHTRYRRKNSY